MSRWTKFLLLLALVSFPLVCYHSINSGSGKGEDAVIAGDQKAGGQARQDIEKARIALIFDDLGQSLQDIKDVYSLKIPLTVAVIPDLKFSKNIAYIADRCDFSVLLHLPMEPKQNLPAFVKARNTFITGRLTDREINALLRKDLGALRVAMGVNNHMGSKATEDTRIMQVLLSVLKEKGLVFVDSHTTEHSCAVSVAERLAVPCAENSGFLDSIDQPEEISKMIDQAVARAREQGKIIVIAHPKQNTFKVLSRRLSGLKDKVEFITLKEYFGF